MAEAPKVLGSTLAPQCKTATLKRLDTLFPEWVSAQTSGIYYFFTSAFFSGL